MGNAYNYHLSRTTVIAIRVAADTVHRLSVHVYCHQINRQGNPLSRGISALNNNVWREITILQLLKSYQAFA